MYLAEIYSAVIIFFLLIYNGAWVSVYVSQFLVVRTKLDSTKTSRLCTDRSSTQNLLTISFCGEIDVKPKSIIQDVIVTNLNLIIFVFLILLLYD